MIFIKTSTRNTNMLAKISPHKLIYILLISILLVLSSNDAFSFTAQERACASMLYACQNNKMNSSSCKQMKKFVKDSHYRCNNLNHRKLAKVFACQQPAEEKFDLNQPNWLSVSWDISNPKIFGYCEKAGAESARRCAYNKCKEKGGKLCKPTCDTTNGIQLRACRLGLQTYIASSDYGRFGCGTRYFKAGRYTPESYSTRELTRCRLASKTGDCQVRKIWKE